MTSNGLWPVLAALAFLSTSHVQGASDELSKMWLTRSALASMHLSQSRIDACDVAFDKAFEHPRETNDGVFRTFDLVMELNGQVLKTSYSFRGGKVASFQLVSLPAGWIARQRASTKTLSILVAPANCAMDFCISDPFVPGACPGDTPE